jgi:hypothetical protein
MLSKEQKNNFNQALRKKRDTQVLPQLIASTVKLNNKNKKDQRG